MPRGTRSKARMNPRLRKAVNTQIKRVISRQQEKKFKDFSLTPTNLTTSGLSYVCSATLQGDGFDARTGDEVMAKRFHLNYQFLCADTTNFCRIMVIQWHEDNAVSVPSSAIILQDPTNLPWLSPVNEFNTQAKRFTVMYDRTHSIALNGTPNVLHRVKLFGKKIPRKRLEYGNGVVTGVDQIYVFAWSDSIAASHPTLGLYTRFEYTDS